MYSIFAIFANFWRKIWRFSQQPMVQSNFCEKWQYVVWAKNAQNKYFYNHNIGPR
jgi:hypothetical protein